MLKSSTVGQHNARRVCNRKVNILASFNSLRVKLVDNYFFGCSMKVEIMDGEHLAKLLNLFKRHLVSRL